MRGSGHLKTAIVSALVGAIFATGTVALAGTGVGGVFNLGQSNTVNATSSLSGTTAGTQLVVSNASTNSAARAISAFSSAPGVGAIFAKNTSAGPAAQFSSLPGSPSIAVNSVTKVASLNADLFDGFNSTAFLKTASTAGGDMSGTFDNLQIKPGAVGAIEVAPNSIDSDEVVDFGLANQDVGVLFAQVNADGTIANSSGGVTGTRIGGGVYEVDFGVNVSSCAFTATQGEAGVGGAPGGITGVTDRSGNPNAVFATMRSNGNTLVDRPFQLIVVC